ncbi:MAG TPA: ABC-2 family transporter protein [Chloroflexota bacterium]|nr:ABC-2 family transporter protein [Chloroflexota bacterium]
MADLAASRRRLAGSPFRQLGGGVVAVGLALAGASLRAQMQYRANFVILVVMGLVYQLTGFVFLWVILSRFGAIAGWTLGEVAFLYGLRLLAHGVYGLLFNAIQRISRMTRRGEFDRYLVRPLPLLLQVLVERVHVAGIGDLLGGIALFLTAQALVGVDWSPPALAYLALAVAGGCLIEAALRLAINSLAFRFLELGSLSFFVDTLIGNFGNYPLRIYGLAAQFLLTFVLPVAFVAYVPAAVLLGRTDELAVHPALAYGAPLVGILLFLLAHRVWRAEMRHYQSAGH